jgi:hypothetical protein
MMAHLVNKAVGYLLAKLERHLNYLQLILCYYKSNKQLLSLATPERIHQTYYFWYNRILQKE